MSSSLGNNNSNEEVPEDIEEEIEEDIRTESEEQSKQLPVQIAKSNTTRALFDLDHSATAGGKRNTLNYDSDDVLAGDNLAVHFHVESSPSDSLDQILNDLKISDKRGESPLGVILLNDQLVSINSLKEKQETENATTNCSTTNDISDLAPDESSSKIKSLPIHTERSHEESNGTLVNSGMEAVPSQISDIVVSEVVEEEEEEQEKSEIVVSAQAEESSEPTGHSVDLTIKPMERCLDFGKEVLEDISEESEQALESLKPLEDLRVYSVFKQNELLKKTLSEGSFFEPKPLSLYAGQEPAEVDGQPAFISLGAAAKETGSADVLLENASNLPSRQSKESLRDHSSLVTNTSTEYRTVQEEYINKMFSIRNEISERDQLIEKLTESLQESLEERDKLQERGLEMADELEVLKSQLSEAVKTLRVNTQNWQAEDQASQRLSEVSLDLVSDEDEFPEGTQRIGAGDSTKEAVYREQFQDMPTAPSKQIEQFQKYLNAEELRIFFMIQKKFDDFMGEEMEKMRLKHDGELKQVKDSLESEKSRLQGELAQLKDLMTNAQDSLNVVQVKEEMQGKHAQEMEGLRQYFEKKCADLEKQYSEEVFSQHSHRHSLDTESDLSDGEEDELRLEGLIASPRKTAQLSAGPSPRRKIHVDISGMDPVEIKSMYEEKISSMTVRFEEQLNGLAAKLQRFEAKHADDELMTNKNHDGNNQLKQAEDKEVAVHIDHPINNNPNDELSQIISEYDRRLQEQVNLARQDVLVDLEKHIQALLSETATEDSHWPPELILLREKFTAKNQLEITQLQIQHEEEMSRVKLDFERRLNRKQQRHTTFDSNRNLDLVVSERDNLRELSITLRRLLFELAKYCSICESDLNNTLGAELQRHGAFDPDLHVDQLNDTALSEDGLVGSGSGESVAAAAKRGDPNQSTTSTTNSRRQHQQQPRFSLDMSSILTLIDDPSLIEYISRPTGVTELEFNLDECLEQLKLEASHILKLSERIAKQSELSDVESEKGDDSCEEAADGLKVRPVTRSAPHRQSSLGNGSMQKADGGEKDYETHSLPSIKSLYNTATEEQQSKMNIHFNELKNRLQKSEDERRSLELELNKMRIRNNSLDEELAHTKEILEIRREDISEGFGANSPVKGLNAPRLALGELQDKAKALLNSSAREMTNASGSQLLQLIEDFCREGDRIVDENKKDRVDLQKQIEAADKQLRSTRQFLEEQATEREHERDEFSREIERLKAQLRDKDKDKSSHDLLRKEDPSTQSNNIETLELQVKEMALIAEENEAKRQKVQDELKASVDKIFVLREIITGLEKQIEEAADREKALTDRIEEMEDLLKNHTLANESFHQESLQMELDGRGYQTRIIELEDKLLSLKPSTEQSLLFDQLSEQLKEIEATLEVKTKTLESLHAEICSQSCSSPSEDVSVRHQGTGDNNQEIEDISPRSNPSTYTVDRMQRVLDKLQKHTQVEQAAIKRMKDLEGQMSSVRASNLSLQHEKDMLQERMSEHLLRISTLQSRLDEQRHQVDDMHRQGTTDLTLRVHDLQVELSNTKEILTMREKQIATLKGHLEESKSIIDRQEAQLTAATEAVPREPHEEIEHLERDLQSKCEEITKLREKIKNEMVNKMALPDLMETIMAEKNEEIDALKETLEKKEQYLEIYANLEMNDDQLETVKRLTQELEQQEMRTSARTLSDVLSISDYDAPDVMRKAESRFVNEAMTLNLPTFDMNRASSAISIPKITPGMDDKRIDSMPEANMLTITPEPVPRHIDFSLLEDTKENSTKNLGEELDRIRAELKARMEENSNLQIELTAKAKLLDIMKSEKMQILLEADNCKLKMDHYDVLKRELEAKDAEMAVLRVKMHEFEELRRKDNKTVTFATNTSLHADDPASNEEQVGLLEEEVVALKRLIKIKDEQLTKLEKETLNYARVEKNYEMEMNELRKELIGKSLALEKCKLDLDESINNVLKLHLQLEKIKEKYDVHAQHIVDDIVEKVEEELNYSAKLDSSILKAIESDDIMSEEEDHDNNKSVQGLIQQADHLDDELRELKRSLDREANRNEELLMQNTELTDQLVEFKQKYETERNNCIRMQLILESEKKSSLTLQQQDAELLDAMRQRLEEAMEHESRLQRVLDDEKMKVERLSNQMNMLQRSKSRESLIKSPVDSPRRAAAQTDSEIARLESEMKLLSAQNEREKGRVRDLHKTLEKEQERFEKEVHDQKAFSDKLAQDLRSCEIENRKLQDALDRAEDNLMQAKDEIDSLEARISNFEDIDARSSNRRHRERLESTQNSLENQDLRMRLHGAEKERENLQEQVVQLRQDMERCTYREIELTRALATEDRDQEHVVGQLNEMKSRMAEALAQLAEERRLNKLDKGQVRCKEELEERANHLFGKYLRVESFRKALVHQKRYLLIVLAAYQESEAKTMAMLKGSQAVRKTQTTERKKRLFKSAVLVVIAIQRMKFVVQRWQSGRRIGAKAIFSSHLTPRRSASASTNVWAGAFGGEPPSRERSHFTATVSTQQLHPHQPLLSSLNENSPFHKYYRH